MMLETFPGFSHAAQQAQSWVDELVHDLGCSEARALQLLRGVLQTLRDFMSPEEVADFSAQLPLVIRGLLFEGWNPRAKPAERKLCNFTMALEKRVGFKPGDNWPLVIRTVFALLERHVSYGEIQQIKHGQKKSVRRLWPAHEMMVPSEFDVVRVLS